MSETLATASGCRLLETCALWPLPVGQEAGRCGGGKTVAAGGGGCFAHPVNDVETSRLRLHPIDEAEGHRIVAAAAAEGDSWADDFPFEGDVLATTVFLATTEALGDQRPFGHYLVTRASDGRAIGGIGFKGPPHEGSVEVGYGLAPSARGHGYAAEALTALLGVAAAHGLARVVADTTVDNIASQRTLERAGFHRVATDGDLHLYELVLRAP